MTKNNKGKEPAFAAPQRVHAQSDEDTCFCTAVLQPLLHERRLRQQDGGQNWRITHDVITESYR